MNEQLKLLIDLQKLDTSILSLVEKIETLPERLKQDKIKLRDAKDIFQKFQTKYDALVKKKKELDLKLDEIQDTIEKLKTRNSDIKTNKEYEAHLKEIESFENNRYKVEDDVLVLMEDIDSYSKVLKEEEAKLKKAESEYAEQEKAVKEDQEKLRAELDGQKTQRNEFASRIEEDYYKQYMTLLERAGGLSVVQTENEICLGCNTNIPPQLYNDIKKNDSVYSCFYCKRILYYQDPSSDESVKEEQAAH